MASILVKLSHILHIQHFVKLVLFLVILIIILQGLHMIFIIRLQDIHPKNLPGQLRNSIIPKSDLKEYIKKVENAHMIDISGTYMIVPNIVTPLGDRSVLNETWLTICAQSTADHLHYLPELAEDFDGPLSVTVFTHDKDAMFALYSIVYLHTCFESVKKYVRFHIVFPISKPPVNLRSVFKLNLHCGHLDSLKEHKHSQNYANSAIPYPHNVLRNVAIDYSDSTYVFMIDIDFVPSKDLSKQFQHFIERQHLSVEIAEKTTELNKKAYIIPCFEYKNTDIPPMTKTSLLKEWEGRFARPFYLEVCWKCQKVTEYDKWRGLLNVGFLDVGYTLEWRDPWEPFYIAKRSALPSYDGRFKQYGFNRISQVCEMHISGYKFAVLNNAFIVHRGFKEEDKFHDKKTEENEINKQHFRDFKLQLKERYPNSGREC